MSDAPKKDTAVYVCTCGSAISDRVDTEAVRERLSAHPNVQYAKTIAFACSEDGQAEIQGDLEQRGTGRCVIAACSVRDHENTFRGVLRRAGLNPYLLQMTNVREHVAWVVEDKARATEKTTRFTHAAVERVATQVPLTEERVDASSAVLIVGAGPAGMKAALQLAEAGRQVTLVERSSALGGMPVLYDEVFPNLECGPCLLEPLMADVLHGPHAARIELLTLTEVSSVKGFYGNFVVELAQTPRFVTDACIGCGECVAACPVSEPDPINCGRNQRKAMSFPYTGPLPNLPQLHQHLCTRFAAADDCKACEAACPMPGVVNFADQARTLERKVGAVVLAVGAELFDCSRIPTLGHGRVENVVQALEFERWVASNGACEGKLLTTKGESPRSVAIVHCVGSLDERHCRYCSGVCCSYAFKFNHLVRHKAPGARITHLYKQLSLSGKDEYRLYEEARSSPDVEFHAYTNIDQVVVEGGGDGVQVTFPKGGATATERFDLVVLCPAMVPKGSAQALGKLFEVGTGPSGFFQELHPRIDAAHSQVKGVYLAGTCQAPMDIQRAVNMGVATAGYVLSGLVEGRQLEVEAITASVRTAQCSGCKTCMTVCPYKAITFDEATNKASVNRLLCRGCGTCVAGCPSGALKGRHFTDDALLAEISGALT